jgi:hypothetical protein
MAYEEVVEGPFPIEELIEKGCDGDREKRLRSIFGEVFDASVARKYTTVHRDGRVWFFGDLRRGRDRA